MGETGMQDQKKRCQKPPSNRIHRRIKWFRVGVTVFLLIAACVAVFLYMKPSQHEAKSKVVAQEKKQAQEILANPTKTPQDYDDLTQKWIAKRKDWMVAKARLKEISGGWMGHRPKDIVKIKRKLEDLLKELFAHEADAKQASKVLSQVKQYFQMEPSKQIKQHTAIKNKLQSMISTLKKDKTPEILDVPLINQMAPPKLYNGCEVTSLAMILQDSGFDVTKTELAKKIPKVPLTYENGLKGNPNYGFVGDIDGSSPGLAVYHEPIAELAKKYAGTRVQDLSGQDISMIYQKLDKGIPVWVITTTDYAPVENMQTWETPHGKVKITFNEHSVVLTGYSKKYIWLNSPYGKKNMRVNRKDFVQSWIQMGRQAIVINPNT